MASPSPPPIDPPPLRAVRPAHPSATPPACSVSVPLDRRWKQGAQFWRGCESGHWKSEENSDRTGIGAVRPTRDERPFRDGKRVAPASQQFAPAWQTPLKTGENPPRSDGLNGFAMVMVAERKSAP